jgi:hypothetical protein
LEPVLSQMIPVCLWYPFGIGQPAIHRKWPLPHLTPETAITAGERPSDRASERTDMLATAVKGFVGGASRLAAAAPRPSLLAAQRALFSSEAAVASAATEEGVKKRTKLKIPTKRCVRRAKGGGVS